MRNNNKIKYKHQKKRNTAFLYEALMRELTKCILEKNEMRKSTIVAILKEHFKKNTLLGQELRLYSSIYETSDQKRNIAERVINEAKRMHQIIDGHALFEEQSALIEKINKKLSSSVFSNFVPFYKNLATISQIFNNNVDIKDRIILEQLMVNEMCSNQEQRKQEEMKSVDDITYRTFLKKFNEKYGGTNLIKEQKELITYYVMSFSDNGASLKYYLNEEISRLKTSIVETINIPEISSNEDMKKKTLQLVEKLDLFGKKEFDKEMIAEILKIQSFVDEANK